ncbi:MAG: hypothetical protein QOG68_126 [Solirubrobacteraceae bacterium]|jgi:hypothetical protein|nr:hypothetical protein [Solirubrobacteraceae bacterium]
MNVTRTRLLAVAAVCAGAAVPAAVATTAVAGPTAYAATKTCADPAYPGQGYFTRLTVTGTSCKSGKKLALAHYRCRTKHGIKGRCPSVSGYSCTEKRQAISTEYNSRVTCKNGSRKVVIYYQQNT